MQKSKKIGYIITKGNWGGAQKYVYNLATNISSNDFDIFAICGEGEILKNKLAQKGIRVYEIRNLKRDISVFKEIKSFIEIFNIIKLERPDILHLNSPKASGIGGVVGRILGIKNIIMTVHGFTFNEDRGFLSKSLISFFSWMTILLCHQTIVINEKEQNQALKMPFIKKEKIKLIKNGIEKINLLERDVTQNKLLQDMQSSYSDCVWIGTIGELHKNKGLDYLIEALSKVEKQFVCIIIGGGEQKKYLEELIQKYRLEEKVFLVGSKESASSLLSAFDIFTLTSRKEGLPYVLLEAGLANLATIASDVGGIPDIIENDRTGILVQKGNTDEIKDAIENIIENKEKRHELGQNLKSKIEKDFSLEQMIEKTLKLYN